MALKDRFRKAIGRDQQRSSSVSTGSGGGSRSGTGGTTTPNHTESPLTLTATSTNNHNDGHPMTKESAQTHTGNNSPAITLTKTHSRLTRSLTWGTFGSNNNKETKPSRKELKERKALEDWKKQDAEEWLAPKASRPGRKNQKCQDTLRAFDFKQFENGNGVRNQSICSGISPSASRANSVADGDGLVRVLSGGRKRSGVGKGGLSQEIEVAGGEPNGEVKEQRMTSVGEE